MARHRFHAPELARLLHSAATPLYVLDADLRIVFLNEACRAWLGPAAEGLVGRQCVYHSGPGLSGPDAAAAGLCPPPVVLSGQEVTADVASSTDQASGTRRARFIPLSAAEGLLGVVAILDPREDREIGPPQADQDAQSRELHELLRRFRREVALQRIADCLVGSSPAVCRARAQAELAAGSSASVLVVGPPGSGRRRLAEAIHYGPNPESAGPLVPLDCSLLDAESIRSVLRRFTSDAPGGSVLLVDADRLPIEAQAEIAGTLPTSARGSGTTRRVVAAAASSFILHPSSFRLISTSEVPLVELARRGRYREDLAAWLSTITIELAPLGQRREDIPLVAQALLEEANARGGKQLAGFSPEALDRLDAYAWPGNLGELAQVVAESCPPAVGPRIDAADLPERLHLAAEAQARPRRKEETILLDEFLDRIQRELIRRALARSKGNKAKAARLLGLNRPRLYRRMAQLGLLEEE